MSPTGPPTAGPTPANTQANTQANQAALGKPPGSQASNPSATGSLFDAIQPGSTDGTKAASGSAAATGKDKVSALKAEGIQASSALWLIIPVLLIVLGVALWFVSKPLAIIVFLVLGALVLLWLVMRSIAKRKGKRQPPRRQSARSPANSTRPARQRRSFGGLFRRNRSGGPSGGSGSNRLGSNRQGRQRRNPFRNSDRSRRNPFRTRPDGSPRGSRSNRDSRGGLFHRADGSRRNPFGRRNNGSQEQPNGRQPLGRSRRPGSQNSNGQRTRGGPLRRADGSSRFRRRPAGSNSSGSAGPRSSRNRGGNHGSSGNGPKPRRWYTPWRRRSRPRGGDGPSSNPSNPGSGSTVNNSGKRRRLYKPWTWFRNRRRNGENNTESGGQHRNQRRRRWYHGPGWSRQHYAGFTTEGDGSSGYKAYRPGNRWEQFRDRHFGGPGDPIRGHATRMDGPNPATGTPTTNTGGPGSYGAYAPTREPTQIAPSTQQFTGTTATTAGATTGGLAMAGDSRVAGNQTGRPEAATHINSASHTNRSAILHSIAAQRNRTIAQEYLNSDDPDLHAAAEGHLIRAAQQELVVEDRVVLTASHMAAANTAATNNS